MPVVVGLKVITKVVDSPGATVAAGSVVTVKSEACAPLMTTRVAPVRFSVPVPLLRMVKVCETGEPSSRLPKLVPSVAAGSASPSAMATLSLPSRSSSGGMVSIVWNMSPSPVSVESIDTSGSALRKVRVSSGSRPDHR